MQEGTDCNAEGSVETEMRSGSEIEMRAKANNAEASADEATTVTNNPETKPKKQKKIHSGRPSLSRSMSGVFSGKLKRLSMSTPSSPVSDHSFEVTPSDPVDHGAKRKSKKPPRSPKQPKGQDEEDSEHKRRTYFGMFKRSSKKQRVSMSDIIIICWQYALLSNTSHGVSVYEHFRNLSSSFRPGLRGGYLHPKIAKTNSRQKILQMHNPPRRI